METITWILIVLFVFTILRVFLLQAKVNDLRSEVDWLKQQVGLGNTFAGTSEKHSPILATDTDRQKQLDEHLLQLIAQGKKIKAIKELRVATNLSLLDAKNYVEELEISRR